MERQPRRTRHSGVSRVRATLICNPNAGKGMEENGLEPALDVFRRSGWGITVFFSDGVGAATRIAREAVESGVEAVLAAGGDGTLNEAIQAVAGTDTAIGYLPYGTV